MTFKGQKIDAAIFDMDGTMFDTERLRFRTLQTASKSLIGESISDQLLMDSLGISAASAEKLAKKAYGEPYPYRQIRRRADDLELESVRNHGVPVKPGLYDVLERLKKSGVLIALATSSRRTIAEEYLVNAKVMRYFDILVCGDDVAAGKPDPEIFLKAAGELNCDISSCLILEDSSNGLLAASAANGIPVYIKDIKDPVPEIKDKAFQAYESMIAFLDDLIPCTPRLPMPKINEQFPQSVGHAKVGIHGFGAIGGGYLAQIFSHWDGYTRPHEIIGATPNHVVRELVNAFGKYAVKYESLAYFETIDRVHAIDMNDESAMTAMYAESEIIGLALPEQAIRAQAGMIAKCLLARKEKTDRPLTILVVMNKIKAGIFVRRHVENALKQQTGTEDAREILRRTCFCETVVNRMVSRIPEEDLLKQIYNKLSGLNRRLEQIEPAFASAISLPLSNRKRESRARRKQENAKRVDSISGRIRSLTDCGQMLSDVNVTLFSSEPDMPLYVSGESPLASTLRQVVVVKDIRKLQEIKNKLSNGTHAVIAWYAALLGYATIGQGMGDEQVFALAQSMMHTEIKPPLRRENPNLTEYMNGFITNFLKRCRLSFKDTCFRVGRDPMRKLQDGERVFGTIRLAQQYGVETTRLEFGAACGLVYAVRLLNSKDREAQIIKTIYEKNHNIRDVLTYHGEYNGSTYRGLDSQRDAALIARVETQFRKLMESVCEKSAAV